MNVQPQSQPVVFRPETDDRGEKFYQTDPPILALKRGEAVIFRHDSDLGGRVFIPHPELFVEEGFVHPLERTPEGFVLVLHVREDAKRQEAFDYAVFSNELQRFAVGNSPPRMILDP